MNKPSHGRPFSNAAAPTMRALLVAIGALSCATPQMARAQNAAGPCMAAAPALREACIGKPLDYRSATESSLQTVSRLPPGQLGKPYPPARLLSGGTPGYTVDPKSRLPPGLRVTPSGFLEGIPSKPGDNVLLLIARDSAQPANITRGIYILKVVQ